MVHYWIREHCQYCIGQIHFIVQILPLCFSFSPKSLLSRSPSLFLYLSFLSLGFPVLCALAMPPSVQRHAAAWHSSARHGRLFLSLSVLCRVTQ